VEFVPSTRVRLWASVCLALPERPVFLRYLHDVADSPANIAKIYPRLRCFGIGVVSMRSARNFALVVLLQTLSVAPASGYVYRTARGLYNDCAAGESGRDAAAQDRGQSCLEYIVRTFNNWNLNQENGVCSQHVGLELPKAYLEYWRARSLGLLSGIVLSAETSVTDFLDSEKQPCPVPDPKVTPP
jgi:hypothetical protein